MYKFYQKHEYLFILLLLIAPQLFAMFFWNGYYRETDSYAHAIRVLNLLNKEIYISGSYVFASEYTSLTDILWVICSSPFMLFVSLKQSVFYGGLVFHAGISVATGASIIWALRPFFSPVLRLVAIGLFFSLPSSNAIFSFARPDHHTLTALFCFLCLGALFHSYKQQKSFHLKVAGIFAGFLLWTSVEGVMIAYILLAALTLLWLKNKGRAEDINRVTFSYFVTVSILWLVDAPIEGWFYPDNGRLSVLYVVIIGFTALSFKILALCENKKNTLPMPKKFALVCILGALSVSIIIFIFGRNTIFAPIFPSEIEKIWASKVSELLPGTYSKNHFIQNIIPALVSILFGALIFSQSRSEQKDILVLTGIPLVFFTLLTFVSIRYSRDSSLFMVFPLLICFQLWGEEKEQAGTPLKRQGLLITTLYLFLLGYLSSISTVTETNTASVERYRFDRTTPYLNKNKGMLLSEVFAGPSLMWATEQSVLGSPMHRNIDGITGTHTILYQSDEIKAIELLKKYNITDIIIPFEAEEENAHPLAKILSIGRKMQIIHDVEGENSLLEKLVMEKPLPCGITKAPISDDNLIYHVDFTACPIE